MSEEFETVYKVCTNCNEEYPVPEDEETCPICGKLTLEEI